MKRALALLLCASAVAGCGPTKDIVVGIKSLALPITLSDVKPTPSPSPILKPPPSPLPPVYYIPQPTFRPVPSPSPSPVAACPDPDPLTFPTKEATIYPSGPAPLGTFPFRMSGSEAVGSQKLYYPDKATRRITASQDGGNGTYSLTIQSSSVLGAVTTITIASTQAQVGLASMTVKGGNFALTFNPPAPLEILRAPADPAAGSWNSAASDPVSATSMTFQGSVAGRKLVNACGQWVDSWEVQGTLHIVSPTLNITDTVAWDIATQYGGWIVRESVVSTSATVGTVAAAIDEHATLSSIRAQP